MKAFAYILLTVLTLTFVSCEKMDTNEILMEGYYQESLKLATYTHAEVQTFGNEFASFVNKNTEVKSSSYYKPTWNNILNAGYEVSITLYGDDEWKGEIEYNAE